MLYNVNLRWVSKPSNVKNMKADKLAKLVAKEKLKQHFHRSTS